MNRNEWAAYEIVATTFPSPAYKKRSSSEGTATVGGSVQQSSWLEGELVTVYELDTPLDAIEGP